MRSIGLLLTLSFFLQCATYWKNRKNDFQDIVTVGAETPMYGAAVKVGPLPIGVLFQGGESEMGKKDLGRGVGLRGGQFGTYHSQQLVFGVLGGESFHSGLPTLDAKGNWLVDKKGIPLTTDERANVKSYKMRYYSYWYDPVKDRKKRKKRTFPSGTYKGLGSCHWSEGIFSVSSARRPKTFWLSTRLFLELRTGSWSLRWCKTWIQCSRSL